MNIEFLFEQITPIPSHATLAWLATLLALIQLFLKKGTRRHKYLGYLWVSAMGYVSISSFFIHEGRMWGPFNWIHLLSVLTLIFLVWAIYAVRNGNIRLHSRIMIFHVISANLITAGFTFLPGRTMHQVFFGM